MIANINYKGVLPRDQLEKIAFTKDQCPPIQKVFHLPNCQHGQNVKLIVFKSGKCRLMGIQIPLNNDANLPLAVNNLQIQSITLVDDIGESINLYKLAHKLPKGSFMFEPELFPALRLVNFNPLCVNIFSSGKIVILGVKNLSYQNLIGQIRKLIL